jgi:hypothetical protein
MCQISVRSEEFKTNHSHHRNAPDVTAAICFGVKKHYSLVTPLDVLAEYDAYFVTMWKVQQAATEESRWMEIIYRLREKFPNKLIILHQEAETEWWVHSGGRALYEQKSMVELLQNKIDIFLAHDDRSRDFYSYFMNRGSAYTWSTIQDIDYIKTFKKDAETKNKRVGINTFDGRAGGITGIAIASRHCEKLIQINRGWYSDDRWAFFSERFGVDLEVVPILSWGRWLEKLTNVYIYLHPMPAASAGRDTIACAALGIPVIGNLNLDAQNKLFPLLAADVFDVKRMDTLLGQMLNDKEAFNSNRDFGLQAVKYFDTPEGEKRAQKILEDYLG